MPRRKQPTPAPELDQPMEDQQPDPSQEMETAAEQTPTQESPNEVGTDGVDEEAIKNALALDASETDLSEPGDQEKTEETQPGLTPAEKVARAKRLLSTAKNARRKYDREWLSRDLFRRGYQFASAGQGANSVALTSNVNSRIPVNLTWAFARSIKNQVTSFKPKWEVLPEYKGKKAEVNARLSGKLLDSVFKKSNMTKLIKDALTQGLFMSVGGPFEAYWDPGYDNGKDQPKGEVLVRLHDPFDVFFDPDGTEVEECSYIIKAVRTDLDRVKANPIYKDKVKDIQLGGTLKRAESEYKQFLLQTIQDNQPQGEDDTSLILYELQEKIYGDDDNVQVAILTWLEGYDQPIRDETIDQEYYDMELFQADMNPLEMYGESWSKHVIAMNRVANALESSIFDYHYRFAKGRLVIDKNSGVRAITNEHGSIIEKNRNATVTDLPITPLPNSYETQLARIYAKMEDISGTHDASLGRVPAAIKSGIGIAELKQSDSTNQDDLVQNLEECLMRLGTKVLKKVARHYTTPRIKRVVGTGRLVEHFAVVGADYAPKGKQTWKFGEELYPLAAIEYNNELSVSIGSWLAYTKEGRQKILMDMAEAGLIDKETVLKYFEFPDISDIVDKTRIESLIEMKRKEDPMMPAGISQEQLAEAENEMLMEGSPVPVDAQTDDHQLHLAVHASILNEENAPQIKAHMDEHRRAMQGGGQNLPAPTNPAQLTPPPTLPMPPTTPPVLPGMGAPGLAPMPAQGMPAGAPAPMPQMQEQFVNQPVPTPTPELAYFSAGAPELPPTASSIIGGPTNQLPTS
jgi:hypothetical protein